MSNGAACRSERRSDPAICSVIFAPKPQNYTLSSVTTPIQITEAIAFESVVDRDEFVRILDNVRRAAPETQAFFAEHLRELFETSFTASTIELPSETSATHWQRVPARTFPFASHFDLLALPTMEGVFFDADDFEEH